MNTFRTYIVKAADGPLAVAICDALGYPEKGMFVAQVDGGTVGYISTGIVDDASPIHLDAAGLLAALDERSPGHSITLAQCEAFKQALDATDDEPFARMEFVRQEIALGATAVPWVQPTGQHDAYKIGDVVTYQGQTWECIAGDANGLNVWARVRKDLGDSLSWAKKHRPAAYERVASRLRPYLLTHPHIFAGIKALHG